MRIVHIGNLESFTKDTANGVKQVIYHVACEQVKQNNEVFVYIYGNTKTIIYTRTCEGVTVVKFPANKLGGFLLSKEMKEHIKSNKDNVDLIHFHSVFIPSNNQIARITNIPYVITPHGGYSTNCFHRDYLSTLKKRIFFPLLEKRFIFKAKKIFCLEENEKKQMPYFEMIKDKIYIIPNGVGKFNKNILESAQNIVFMGRLDKVHKGLDLLLLGYKIYFESSGRNPKMKLIIVGPDTCHHKLDLKKIVADGQMKDYVQFRDKVYGEEKEKILKNTDIFVHTSRWEGLPISVLEALAHGIPVLLSKETNLGMYVKKYSAGWILGENTPKAIGVLLKRIEDENLKQYSENAYKLANQEFDWEQIVSRLNLLYLS